MCSKSGYYNRENLAQRKSRKLFWQKLTLDYGFVGVPTFRTKAGTGIQISAKRLRRLGNYDPRNLLVRPLFLLKITSLSKVPPSPWLQHPPEPQKVKI